MNPRFPTLLSPIRVGPLTLKNRTMIPGHNTWLGDHDGTVNERFRAYMTARAKGGCALITIGSSPIHRSSEDGGHKLPPAIDWFQAELMRLQVRVRLNTRVRNQREIDADDVIWALGTSPGATAIWRTRPHLEHGIPGAAGLPHGRAVLGGRASVHGHVLMIDEEGGWMAVSLAETLVARPGVTKLTVVTNEAALGMPELGFTLENTDVQARLKATGMVIVLRRLVTRVEGGQAVLDDGQRLGPFDSMVLSTGTLSNITPDGAHAVGDCVTPRGFWAAVNDAHRLARSL